MDRKQEVGATFAALAVLLVAPCSTMALRYVGHTDQSGNRLVEVTSDTRGQVEQVSFEWIANCHGGGAIRSKTVIKDLHRATHRSFRDRFRGRVTEGRHTLKMRYAIYGKRKNLGRFFGTFRLSARYVGKNKPKDGTCRTRLVRWVARNHAGDSP